MQFRAAATSRRLLRPVCVVLGVAGWVNLAVLGRAMLADRPPRAGFDLELLLEAARRVASGQPLYDPAALASNLGAKDLFYAYPPLVAQALVPLAGLPSWLVLTGWCVGAVAGLALVAALIPRSPLGRPAVPVPGLSLDTALLALAAGPFFFPLFAALLFGNVDAWFPLLLGAVVLALAPLRGPAVSRGSAVVGGVALAVAAVVKIYPGVLLFWLAARWGRREGDKAPLLLLAAGAAFCVALAGGLSLLAGGLDPWRDYVGYLGRAANADLASASNIGPAGQVALLTGDAGLARLAAVVAAVAALSVASVVGWVADDVLESVAVAIVASFVLLPVTWYHYPVALLPVALAAWTRSRGSAASNGVNLRLAAAFVVADLSIALPVVQWLAVGLVLTAVRASRPRP